MTSASRLDKKFLDADDVAQRLGHLLAAELQHAVVDPVARELLARVDFRSARSRFRDAGRSGRCRRRGCRSVRRVRPGSWQSTRCASRGVPCPRDYPMKFRRAWRLSTERNPLDDPWLPPLRCARLPACHRVCGRRACRNPCRW